MMAHPRRVEDSLERVLQFFATEIHIPFSEARLNCRELLQHEPEWIVKRLNYSTSHGDILTWVGLSPTTMASLECDLFNAANDFVIDCLA
jgi:hypothetical protein